MENNNSDKLKTIAWIVIIFCVIFLTALLASGILEVKVNLPKEQKGIQETNTEDTTKKLDTDKYSSIINKYIEAINDKDSNNKPEEYQDINNNMINYNHNYGTKLYYTYYDINKDGKNELVINVNGQSSEFNIAEIYTYNGTKPIRFINDDCLGERCSAEIYDDGTIFFYAAGGASVHGLEFYKIATDGYSKETIGVYGVERDNNETITIKQGDNQTNYKSDEEVIKSVVKDANTVDLSKLNWIELK